MNDKNFIEELRQKREEYGVTQTRLAVACGISREYYNRIEKGKQPLNHRTAVAGNQPVIMWMNFTFC